MMEVTNENIWVVDKTQYMEGKLERFARKNKILSVLIISLISFTTINIVLLYIFIRNIEML